MIKRLFLVWLVLMWPLFRWMPSPVFSAQPQYVFSGFNKGASSGTALVGNYGGTGTCGAICGNGTDTGNAGIEFFTPIIAPANSTSWQSFNVWITSPQTSASNRLDVYSDTTVSCTGSAPHCPYTLICTYPIATWGSSGWISVSPASFTQSCGTPVGGTMYHLGQFTNNNSQNQGTSGVSATCPNSGGLTSGVATGVSATAPTFGSAAPSLNYATEVGTGGVNNGCYDTYAAINYTSTAAYNIISVNNCSASTMNPTACSIPPTKAGDSLYIVLEENSGGAGGITSVYDGTGLSVLGSSTDTITNVGSWTGVSGGARNILYYIDRPTTGINNITLNTSTSSEYVVFVVEVQGTKSSGSADKNTTDTAYLTSSPFTSANCSGTLSQAQEFALAPVMNNTLTNQYVTSLFTGTNGWNTLYTTGSPGSNGAVTGNGLFYQITSATTSLCVKGTFTVTSGADVLPSIGTFE
jgi:hypothetical protein